MMQVYIEFKMYFLLLFAVVLLQSSLAFSKVNTLDFTPSQTASTSPTLVRPLDQMDHSDHSDHLDQQSVESTSVDEDKNQQSAESIPVDEDKNQQSVESIPVDENKNQQSVETISVDENKNQQSAESISVDENKNQQSVKSTSVDEDKNQQSAESTSVDENKSQQSAESISVDENKSQQSVESIPVDEDKKDLDKAEDDFSDILNAVEAKYTQMQTLQSKVTKTNILKLLQRQNVHKGELQIKKGGLMRLEFKTPVRSILLINTKGSWHIQYPDTPAFDDTIRVISSKTRSILEQALLSILELGDILKYFNLLEAQKTKASQEDSSYVFKLKPHKDVASLHQLEVEINDQFLITRVTYQDALENKTSLHFSEISINKKIKDAVFIFKKPKDAEVIAR